MKRYLFQCNANKDTGLGHLSRCLNIALAIQLISTNKIIFIGEYNSFAKSLLSEHRLPYCSQEKIEFGDNDTLILDDYNIVQKDITQLRERVKNFVKIDDFHDLNLSSLDLVINFRLNAETDEYSSNYNAKQTCLGLNYFPFHQKLLPIRAINSSTQRDNINTVNNIFIFIGGEDKYDAGHKLLCLLDNLVSHKNLYLIDKNHQQLTKPISNKESNNQLHYLPLSANMANYYQQADIFISGGGLSKYEAAFCVIANAAISQNEGQALDTKMLADEGLTFDLGLTKELSDNPNKISNSLQKFLTINSQHYIINNCQNKFMHNSTEAVANAIDSL